MVESTLGNRMAEHLNAEIALGTIINMETAMQWVQSTFYYVRVKKNPKVCPSNSLILARTTGFPSD